jgi:hypothetical protein
MIDRTQLETMRKQAEALALKQRRETIVRDAIRTEAPITLQNDKRHLDEMNDLVSRLSKPAYLDLFAKHEAGHEIYFRRAGVTDFEYITPVIHYDKDDKENPFLGQWAAIRPKTLVTPENIDDSLEDFNRWLLAVAKGYAAGGVCSLRLTDTDYAGDRNDRKQFKKACNAAYSCDDADKFMDVEDIWTLAQKEIGADLDDEGFQNEVRHKAKELMPMLFPWWLRVGCSP